MAIIKSEQIPTYCFRNLAILFAWNAITSLAFAGSASFPFQENASSQPTVNFSKDVLPILSNKCFRCHGPDENTRMAGLRLDRQEYAIESGILDSTDPDESELLTRILGHDDSDIMPPPDSGIEPLTDKEVATLRRWIEQGANWDSHWAFVPLVRPKVPDHGDQWIANSIDAFVFSRMKEEGWVPAKRADKSTLLRRAALLITGLPPAEKIASKFMNDESPDAFNNLVDQLLATQAYGEHMAAKWLDIARYSDTDGFQQDEPRSNWPWRDWVIDAYNNDTPFDQFTIEQTAGDLLPNPTPAQILATAFHRNHMTNSEGGRDPAESRVDYVLDRVNTVGTAWLGLTLGCAQCHTHKYDPISHREYYQLSAFFNSIDEDGRAGKAAKPYLDWTISDTEQILKSKQLAIDSRVRDLDKTIKILGEKFPAWLAEKFEFRDEYLERVLKASWATLELSKIGTTNEKVRFESETGGIWRLKKGTNPNNETYTLTGTVALPRIGSLRIETFPHGSFTDGGLAFSNSGNFVLTDVVAHVVRKSEIGTDSQSARIPIRFTDSWSDYSQPNFEVKKAIDRQLDTGWAVWSGDMTRPRTAVFRLAEPIELLDTDQLEIQLVHFSHNPQHNIGRFRVSISPRTEAEHSTRITEILQSIESNPSLDDDQRTALLDYFVDHNGAVGVARALLNRQNKELANERSSSTIPVMVLQERPQPRETFVLARGVWNAHTEKVFANVPEAIGPKLPTQDGQDRLDLANWLVDQNNPLTARVAVNRYWQMYFGRGLVRTPEDFGIQGQLPTHPGLLDWLAIEFIESGWNIKHIQRLIATSSTFQQSSVLSASSYERDPHNQLLARGPRFRLPAATIRDQALAVSGLLSDQIGGPSVMPYQPENVWSASDQGKYPYVRSTGDDLYRRSLYTYWRRNIAPPGMFDSAERRVCEVNVRRTNSPMHALNLMNDETYVEAARVLAQRTMKQTTATNQQMIEKLFQLVLFRIPDKTELVRLTQSMEEYQSYYSSHPKMAETLMQQGEYPIASKLNQSRLAALTIVANTILNLDETLNVE